MAEAGAGKGQSPPWATPACCSGVRSSFLNAPLEDVSVHPRAWWAAGVGGDASAEQSLGMLSSRLGLSTLCGFPHVGLGWGGGPELHGVLPWRPREGGSGARVSCKQFIARSFPPALLAARKSSRKIFPWELFFVPSSVSVRMKLSSALDMPQPVPRLRLIPCATRDDS